MEILRWAAQRGMTVTMHWPNDASADTLLSIYERVNAEFPVADLRWSVAHLTGASPEHLRRMKAMGVGWTIQRPNAAAHRKRHEHLLGRPPHYVPHVLPGQNPQLKDFAISHGIPPEAARGGAKL
jgi:predicted amidohydrolase YtcJ